MRKLSKREQGMLIFFGLFLVVILALEFIVFPSIDRINALEAEKSELQSEWDSIQVMSGTENALKQRIETLEEENELLNAQLPDQDSSHLYWEYIQKQALENNIELIQLHEGSTDELNNTMEIQLIIAGEPENVFHFIKSINDMPYINAISDSVIERIDGNLQSHLLIYAAQRDRSGVPF